MECVNTLDSFEFDTIQRVANCLLNIPYFTLHCFPFLIRLGKPETLSFFKRREERHGSVGQGCSWYDNNKLIGRYHRAPPSEIQDAKLIINETKGS